LQRDTIYALSSGQPPAAIAIIRISGPKSLQALKELAGIQPEPRRATLADLSHDGTLLDRALVLRFEAPNTVTGEDLVELHLHGGRAVVAAVLQALFRVDGLRPAEPGEFTRRAFANGRIDLTEAEGLADLLAAETEAQHRSALRLAGGALSRLVENWTNRLLVLAAQVEARLDFSDEADVDTDLPPLWYGERQELVAELTTLLARPPAERLRDGIRVVIAGPPNSGKSTLLNALVGREAAITSEIAGTTRDLIEAPVAIGGTPFVLTDSAGLRESEDRIESIGVDRAQAAIDAADLVLWLGPVQDRPARSGVITLHPKSDLAPNRENADLAISARTGHNMDALTAILLDRARSLLPGQNEVAANTRQRAALASVLDHLQAADPAGDLLIAAEELRQARLAFDRITGRAGVEDMLDTLFARFCLGK
jgi:tRNA modification GTPase